MMVRASRFGIEFDTTLLGIEEVVRFLVRHPNLHRATIHLLYQNEDLELIDNDHFESYTKDIEEVLPGREADERDRRDRPLQIFELLQALKTKGGVTVEFVRDVNLNTGSGILK